MACGHLPASSCQGSCKAGVLHVLMLTGHFSPHGRGAVPLPSGFLHGIDSAHAVTEPRHSAPPALHTDTDPAVQAACSQMLKHNPASFILPPFHPRIVRSAQALDHWARKQASAVLAAWHTQAVDKSRLRVMRSLALEWYAGQLQRKALLALFDRTLLRHAHARIVTTVQARMKLRLAKDAFSAWYAPRLITAMHWQAYSACLCFGHVVAVNQVIEWSLLGKAQSAGSSCYEHQLQRLCGMWQFHAACN